MHILDTKLSILGRLLKSIEEKVKSLSKWSKIYLQRGFMNSIKDKSHHSNHKNYYATTG